MYTLPKRNVNKEGREGCEEEHTGSYNDVYRCRNRSNPQVIVTTTKGSYHGMNARLGGSGSKTPYIGRLARSYIILATENEFKICIIIPGREGERVGIKGKT